MPRLFVAVWPPEDVLDRLQALERPAVPGLRWTNREQWHVTLRFLGEVPDVETVVAALEAMPRPRAAEATLGPAVARFGQRILHVPVSGLDGVAENVVAATSQVGSPSEDRPFAGHVTLGRVAKGAHVDLRTLAGPRVSGSWIAAQICVVESRLSPAGARYEVRASCPLEE